VRIVRGGDERVEQRLRGGIVERDDERGAIRIALRLHDREQRGIGPDALQRFHHHVVVADRAERARERAEVIAQRAGPLGVEKRPERLEVGP
jgi:hypothetical protein